MLLTPRNYRQSQTPDRGSNSSTPFLVYGSTVKQERLALQRAQKMLLLRQTGSVKVGEVIRYTVTYTPSADRILPTPSHLHVKVKNTEAIPFRAAYLHGPFTIHASAYPSTFNPNEKIKDPKRYGIPEYEPNVKAGASWNAKLVVPEEIRESGNNAQRSQDGEPKSATWIIEIASQILFSKSATIAFEVLVARDERSLELGFANLTGKPKPNAGTVQDAQGVKHQRGPSADLQKGVYSKAIKLVVQDTASLWDKPELPQWDKRSENLDADVKRKKQKRVHLVVLTHGLHSNVGADMLYMKESIDGTIREARESRRKRREESKGGKAQKQKSKDNEEDETPAPANLTGGQEDVDQANKDDDDDELTIVRGFNGNAIRTEKGIQYLGKRLAKHILCTTYPDQPFMPIKKTLKKKMSNAFSPAKSKPEEGIPVHEGSSIQKPKTKDEPRAYKYTSISFVGHSLGGLVQTYAIAYIQKHSPKFFETIQPINFICMASPLLGLSNENPTYVKFALDFGLVGRTGQDLGLTWRAPTLAKSGWSAMVGGLGASNQKTAEQDPGSKPLLRILPTGPAHHVLRLFRNRTLYSNVVNDGIVPLRTSCLLFLDWRGIERVEKARRDNGLIGTVAEWGYAQLTGQNSAPYAAKPDISREQSPNVKAGNTEVPLPEENMTNDDDTLQTTQTTAGHEPTSHKFLQQQQSGAEEPQRIPSTKSDSILLNGANAVSRFLSFLQPSGAHTSKDNKMFHRSQTTFKADSDTSIPASSENTDPSRRSHSTSPAFKPTGRPKATRGDTIVDDPSKSHMAPPKTTIFESAGDLINPPLPPTSWIIDPASRSRTIFHDRVYHPEDIPPPPTKPRTNRFGRTYSSDSITSDHTTSGSIDSSPGSSSGTGMKVEEKIARAYHHDLSWRKVLVRLEPDAHNNLIVRRIFANAYGWPVVKHLCDTHFADTFSAQTRDEEEAAWDRAKGAKEPVGEDGIEVEGQRSKEEPERSTSEMREATDELAPLREADKNGGAGAETGKQGHANLWDDHLFETSESDDDSDIDDRFAITRLLSPSPKNRTPTKSSHSQTSETPPHTQDAALGTSPSELDAFLHAKPNTVMEGHRGLLPTPTRFEGSRSPPGSPKGPGTGSTPTGPRATKQTVLPDAPLVASPPPIATAEATTLSGRTTDVGLRKTVDEQMGVLKAGDEMEETRGAVAGKKRMRGDTDSSGERAEGAKRDEEDDGDDVKGSGQRGD